MNASPIKAVVNDTGKQCQRCGARPRYPHTLGCTVAYPKQQEHCPLHTFVTPDVCGGPHSDG